MCASAFGNKFRWLAHYRARNLDAEKDGKTGEALFPNFTKASLIIELQMERQQKIVVTGIGLATCLGASATTSRERSARGESGIGPLEEFDVSGHACKAAAAVPPFELESLLRIPKNQKFMSRSVKLGVLAAKDAIAASGLDLAGQDPGRVGLQLGSGQPGLEPPEFFAALDLMSAAGQEAGFKELGGRPSRLIDRYFPLRTLSNAGTGLLSPEIGARGPGNNFVESATASAMAIGTGCYDLLENRCDVVIAGGYDSLLIATNYLEYEQEGLLSPAPPQTAYQPFDCARDGLVLGEGAGMLVLEREEEARRRNAVIIGEIAGYGNAMDASDSVPPVGSEAAARAACQQALGDNLPDCIIAHGIGTREGDRREAALLAALFGRAVPVTALKSQTGYLGAATAAVEIGLGLLAMQEGRIPPIARLCNPDPAFSLDFVIHSPRLMVNATPSVLCMTWSWTGQCTALVARALRG